MSAMAQTEPTPALKPETLAPGVKSYADIASETPPSEPAEPITAETSAELHMPKPVKPQINTAPGPKSYADMVLQTPPDSPRERPADWRVDNSTPQELEGKGLQESPTTPTFGHRRAGSRHSPKPRSRNRDSWPSAESKVPEESQEDMEDNIVYEKYTGGNGEHLVSVKATADYEENLKVDEREKKRNRESETKGEQELELVSGRQAAAGWEKSG